MFGNQLPVLNVTWVKVCTTSASFEDVVGRRNIDIGGEERNTFVVVLYRTRVGAVYTDNTDDTEAAIRLWLFGSKVRLSWVAVRFQNSVRAE